VTDSVPATFGFVSKIVDALKDQAVPIDEIIPHPNNVRKHRLDKIAQSLTAFGQVSPIIVDEATKEILKGNGTWQAAKLLGWTHIAVQYTTFDDEINKRHYMMSDNRASDLGSYYRERLAGELRALSTEPGVNDTLWEPDEIEDLLEEVDGLSVMPAKGTVTVTTKKEAQTPEEKEAGKKGTAYLKESTLLFSQAEHVRFAGMVAKLRGIYELDATHTILEAVERQYEAEMNGATQLGAIPADDLTAFAVRRWYVDVLREPLSKMGNAEMLAMVDQLVPVATSDQVPGQTGMDDTYTIQTGVAAGDEVPLRLPTVDEAVAMARAGDEGGIQSDYADSAE
jgi:hypothetical protein